jgi:hypothetical protein
MPQTSIVIPNVKLSIHASILAARFIADRLLTRPFLSRQNHFQTVPAYSESPKMSSDYSDNPNESSRTDSSAR